MIYNGGASGVVVVVVFWCRIDVVGLSSGRWLAGWLMMMLMSLFIWLLPSISCCKGWLAIQFLDLCNGASIEHMATLLFMLMVVVSGLQISYCTTTSQDLA